MNDLVSYAIESYGIFLQRNMKDFGGLIDREVLVTAIIECHPKVTQDFHKVYMIFVDGKHIPEFNEELHIRVNEDGEKCVYLFRPYETYLTYVDLLRNEKPVTLWWSKRNNFWQLATGTREPVGEGPGG
ncbi:MAG: hypothetical protein ACFFEF_09640 [Candidatus Thorarchaeota archaeon]